MFKSYKSKKTKQKVLSVRIIKWQIWLTSDSFKILEKDEKHNWEKARKENLTGTNQAYHPVKEMSDSKKLTKKKYNNWDPN